MNMNVLKNKGKRTKFKMVRAWDRMDMRRNTAVIDADEWRAIAQWWKACEHLGRKR
jgi:hypothetical protein